MILKEENQLKYDFVIHYTTLDAGMVNEWPATGT